MKKSIYKIVENKKIAPKVYKMVLQGDVSELKNPGEFVEIQLDGFYLRRPISISDVNDDTFTIIYKSVGKGTEEMSKYKEGKSLDILTGLGNGYSLENSGQTPVLIGGGIGLPPLYYLAKQLVKQGKNVKVIMGFNNSDEVFYKKEFELLGIEVFVIVRDGSDESFVKKGVVTDVLEILKGEYSYFYSCGALPMLKAIENIALTDGEFSLEERMGCGFGACMGCSCKTKNGYKRVCKDGPVFKKGEVLWED